jgi:hypothetical protein
MRLVEGQKEKDYKNSITALKNPEIEQEKRWMIN